MTTKIRNNNGIVADIRLNRCYLKKEKEKLKMTQHF